MSLNKTEMVKRSKPGLMQGKRSGTGCLCCKHEAAPSERQLLLLKRSTAVQDLQAADTPARAGEPHALAELESPLEEASTASEQDQQDDAGETDPLRPAAASDDEQRQLPHQQPQQAAAGSLEDHTAQHASSAQNSLADDVTQNVWEDAWRAQHQQSTQEQEGELQEGKEHDEGDKLAVDKLNQSSEFVESGADIFSAGGQARYLMSQCVSSHSAA